MRIIRLKPAPKEAQRIVLDYAANLILKTGLKEVDIKELAHESGVQRANIYNYFGKTRDVKGVIFRTIIEEFLCHAQSLIKGTLETIDPKAATPMELLAAVFRATLAAFKSDELFGKVVLQQLNLAKKKIGSPVFQIFSQVDKLIAEARKAGQLNEHAKSLRDAQIRQIIFVLAHGLLRALYLKEGITEADLGAGSKSNFTERQVTIEVLRVLQLYCSNEASNRIQTTIDALADKKRPT